ncbi:AAL138Cp [Eremothecium gossypii ATCC 10895]|uniref:AAL138Cp n=1 Tax=Eremothecium gossypii (strain ATCC 10895 / CBS 109.51 / FGSC 9923 / NRRL Y-1056) TaxID=284811 RepID=Q75F66_EREGS|nr:AAL138Cp [Eremothecium gossypii ATCC 10895]AAS50228.1 AAL138Cp [Eremothecium gossypii ATCC 10895]AEY94513.1 FAAL138Cp [Eremothecium gossypii FDAG1]
MARNILDEIASESDPSQDEEGSLLAVDGDAFRLDQAAPAEPAARELFLRDDSESPLRRPHGGSGSSEGGSSDAEGEAPETQRRPEGRKRVKFSAAERGVADFNPWDIRRAVRRAFRDKLPENYSIKTWRRPPRALLRSLADLLSANADNAVEGALSAYHRELTRTLGPNELAAFRHDREQLIRSILHKLRTRLKRTHFPARVSEHVLDIEDIYARRTFIQQRHIAELNAAEDLERQLLAEQQALAARTAERSDASAKVLLDRLTANLHPALNKAVSNAYGLIKDAENTRETYLADCDDLNLHLSDTE